MQTIRIVDIPVVKAAYSGPLTDSETFEAFNTWFSAYHAALKQEIFPRDFMWYNEAIGAQEWFYALPQGFEAGPAIPFPVVDLPGGLFAAASCLDADLDEAADWLRTREELLRWAEESPRFRPYENGPGKPRRYPLFHIVSPGRLAGAGISIEDLYLPIEEREEHP